MYLVISVFTLFSWSAFAENQSSNLAFKFQCNITSQTTIEFCINSVKKSYLKLGCLNLVGTCDNISGQTTLCQLTSTNCSPVQISRSNGNKSCPSGFALSDAKKNLTEHGLMFDICKK